jgi:hypothetical protein
MNIQSDITNDHNQDNRFKDFDVKLADIEKAVFKAQKFLNSHNLALYDALSITLGLGYAFNEKRKTESDKDWLFLKDYLSFHGERWSTKCETNIFHGLVSIAFNQLDKNGKEITTAPTLSKYRAVLRYANEREIAVKDFKALLESRTLAEVYQDAISAFRFDPIDHYIEDDEERYDRAISELDQIDDLPSGEFTKSLTKPDTVGKYVSAIVKLNDNGFEVVGFVGNEKEEQIKSKIISLVPEEAPYVRRKLKDKNHYLLYVMCDIFKRFTPDIATIRSWNSAFEKAQLPVLNEHSNDEEIADYFEKLKQNSVENEDRRELAMTVLSSGKKGSVADGRFTLLNALDFKQVNKQLIVTTRTTHPNTPCLEFVFPFERSFNKFNQPIMIKDLDAFSFSNNFLKPSEWSMKKQAGGFKIVSDNESHGSLNMQDYSQLAKWRSFNKDLSVFDRFKLDKFTLDVLSNWKSDFANTPNFGRRAFSSIHKLKLEDGALNLAFPNIDSEIRILGVALDENSATELIKERLFGFNQVIRLVELAKDYGIEYEFELLGGHQGETALKFYCIGLPMDVSITIPLMLSVKGNPTEITK